MEIECYRELSEILSRWSQKANLHDAVAPKINDYFSILYYNFLNKYSKPSFREERKKAPMESSLLFSPKNQRSKGDTNGAINRTIELSTPEVFSRTNRARSMSESAGNGGCCATLGIVVVAAAVIVVGESSKVSRGCWVAAMLDSCRRANPWCLLVIVARDATTPPDRRRHALRIADGPMTPGRRDAGVHQ